MGRPSHLGAWLGRGQASLSGSFQGLPASRQLGSPPGPPAALASSANWGTKPPVFLHLLQLERSLGGDPEASLGLKGGSDFNTPRPKNQAWKKTN